MKVNQQCNPRKSLQTSLNNIDVHTTTTNHDALSPRKKNHGDSPVFYKKNGDTAEEQIPACNDNLNGVKITQVKSDQHVYQKRRTIKGIETKA